MAKNNIQKITTNLWFDHQAEDAAKFYTSIFKNSSINTITYYGKEGSEISGNQEGTVLTVEFELDGQVFVALNGGPKFKFSEAISFIVKCESQEELDYFWEKLSEGGDKRAQVCGWLKDKYSVSWQIIPSNLTEMITSPDSEKTARVMKALYQMTKLDIRALEEAYNG